MVEVILIKGFNENERQQIESKAEESGPKDVKVVSVREEGMSWSAEKYCQSVRKGGPYPQGMTLEEPPRFALLSVGEKKRAVALSRIVQSASPQGEEVVCAMLTVHSKQWPLQRYFDHISKEHVYMKTHDPAKDPDMSPV